jgi:hypothetical protein
MPMVANAPRHSVAALIGLFLLASLIVVARPGIAEAAGGTLYFSEYVEGSGGNQALEIYNPGDVPVDLAASGYVVETVFAGGGSARLSLTGVVAAHGVHVVANAAAAAAVLAVADQASAGTWFDGDDAVTLTQGGTPVDVIGQVGVDPGTAWGSGNVTTADHTLGRKASVSGGDPIWSDAFDPATEWDAYPVDTFDGLGSYGEPAPPPVNEAVAISCPTSLPAVAGVATGASLSATDPDGTVVAFSVDAITPVDPGTIQLTGIAAAGEPGGTAAATLTVGGSTPAGSYTVGITATNDDAVAQSASCSVAVEVTASVGSLAAVLDRLVADGTLDAGKAQLLRDRLNRASAFLANGQTDAYRSQLEALGEQAQAFVPRWLTQEGADLLRAAVAALLAQ